MEAIYFLVNPNYQVLPYLMILLIERIASPLCKFVILAMYLFTSLVNRFSNPGAPHAHLQYLAYYINLVLLL